MTETSPPTTSPPARHNLASAWPLYSPSASHVTAAAKRTSVPTVREGDSDGTGVLHNPPQQTPELRGEDRKGKKGKNKKKGGNGKEGEGGKSKQQREKDEEEEELGRRGGEEVVSLRENILKAEATNLLQCSRSPIPTRRKKARHAVVGGEEAASNLNSTHIAISNLHISNHNSMAVTVDVLKQRQYEQFLAMAQVMKGDSFDNLEPIDHTPPTSPRFLSLSTGSGLVAAKTQQRRKNGGNSSSHSHPLHNRHRDSSSQSSLLGRLQQRHNLLLVVFLLCIASSVLLLMASYTGSTSGLLNRISFNLKAGDSPRFIQSPDEVDDSWFFERRGKRGNEEKGDLTSEILSDDMAYAFDIPADESYKYRDYPFLLHNAVPRVAKDGTVIMVIANSGYLEFLLNWKAYVDQQNITNYVIIPVDVQMAQQLSYLGVDWAYDPEIGMDYNSQSVDFTISKKSAAYAKWNKVVHKKSHYFKKLLEMGYSVMVSDIDMVWLKNPFTIMADKEVDMFFINDWDKPRKYKSPLICGGLVYGKQRKKSLAYITHVINCEEMKDKKEQYCMNLWFESLRGKAQSGNDIVITEAERPKYQIMSINDFPSGGFYFGKDWGRKPEPYVVHNNWIVGKANKLARFKAFGYWRVDDASLTNLMINFRFDEHRGQPERGREGEIADELMVYHKEMRKKFGKFDDGIWLLEQLPLPERPVVESESKSKSKTAAAVEKGGGEGDKKKQTTAMGSSAGEVDSEGTSAQSSVRSRTAGKVKPGPSKKATPAKRIASRNPNYKFVDGSPNPHYSAGR